MHLEYKLFEQHQIINFLMSMDPDRRGRLVDWYKIRPDDASPCTGIKPTANSRGEINDKYEMGVEDANNPRGTKIS